MPNYNPIARIYDPLSRLVFGKAQLNAQIDLLHSIPAGANILIVGGGTGWILDEITRLHPTGLQITYIDSSARMIALAKKRKVGQNVVSFLENDILAYKAGGRFDVIITPFLFDNFSENQARVLFEKLDQLLVPGGVWLYTDFHISKTSSRIWQRVLLRSMYLFFKMIAGVNVTKLPAMHFYFDQKQYIKNLYKLYYQGFIESIIYQKSTNRGAVPAEQEPFVEDNNGK